MTGIAWAKRAIDDLVRIESYYVELSPEFANALLRDIIRAAQFLLGHPRAGTALDDGRRRKWRIRGAPSVLIYRPERNGVRILRAQHSAEDWRER